MSTYAPHPVAFVRGEGCLLWDQDGKEYLDFLAGIAVCNLGHCNPAVSKAIQIQAETLVHTSNLFQQPLQSELASKLCSLTGMDAAFFCNSGAESIETAIKIARKWGRENKGPGCTEIVVLKNSFHGRTLGALAATAQPKYQEPFAPMLPGFRVIDPSASELRAAVGASTCAVLVEPIQGEGGIHVLDESFLNALSELKGVLLIADEIQCGMDRTGTFLACQTLGLKPDIVTLAKGLGNGFPIGACLARGEAATSLCPGDHGSTFGGNPLACATALAVLKELQEEGVIGNVASKGKLLFNALTDLQRELPGLISDVRGRGLMLGIELSQPLVKQVAKALLMNGLVVGTSGESVIRLLPPLIVSAAQCEAAVQILAKTLSQVNKP
jgi:acetylornithine/N-succinyldiaminopimelate aminotransferase